MQHSKKLVEDTMFPERYKKGLGPPYLYSFFIL